MKRLMFVLCTAALASTGAFAAEQNKEEKSRKPDNTAMNERDRNAPQNTAQGQSNSEQDRNLTAQIRKAVVDDKNLSTYGHNIKIISKDGQVTLRGPVRNQDEKNALGKKAQDIAGADKVNNQLEVSPPETRGKQQHENRRNQ